MARSTALLITALVSFAQLTGCATISSPALTAPNATTAPVRQPYRFLGGNRYISGPYGSAADIETVIARIERRSPRRKISVRGVELTDLPAYSFIDVYSYTFPRNCGKSHFQVFKGDGIEILEYDDKIAAGGPVQIRDYVRGPSPFVGPGLWGPYDSSSNAPAILVPGTARQGGMGLMHSTYAIGWLTTLSPHQQAVLGHSYERAVERAARCDP